MFVDIQLAVGINEYEMFAHLVFFNKTDETHYLDTKTICTNGQTRRSIFNITDANNIKIKYAGIMEKRFVVPEDFITINSGDKIETNIKLNDVYKIKKGQKYFIQYSVYHPSYMDEQGLCKFESNTVEVVY
jgi:hypothetical protein